MSQPKAAVFAMIALFTSLVIAVATLAVSGQKQNVPKTPDKLAQGDEQIRLLLPLMDTDKNGKVSKQEFLRFMEAEFDRLDTGKTGQLNVKELTKPSPKTSQSAVVGK